MEPMESTAESPWWIESPWKRMENGFRALETASYLVWGVAALLWAIGFVLLFFFGRFDVGTWLVAVLGLAVANALNSLCEFCEGAMERVRQLSTMV